MVCRLLDLSLVVLKVLMLNICGVLGISKIKFFDFSGTERVKGAVIDMRYFARNKFSRSLVHKKNFS